MWADLIWKAYVIFSVVIVGITLMTAIALVIAKIVYYKRENAKVDKLLNNDISKAEKGDFKQALNQIDIQEWLKSEGRYVMKKAIAEYGKDHQKGVAIEEQSELIKEICKDLRGIGKRENIVEEIADVEIMLYQLKQMDQITEDELEIAKYGKLRRLEGRIQDHMLARLKELENGKRT